MLLWMVAVRPPGERFEQWIEVVILARHALAQGIDQAAAVTAISAQSAVHRIRGPVLAMFEIGGGQSAHLIAERTRGRRDVPVLACHRARIDIQSSVLRWAMRVDVRSCRRGKQVKLRRRAGKANQIPELATIY